MAKDQHAIRAMWTVNAAPGNKFMEPPISVSASKFFHREKDISLLLLLDYHVLNCKFICI
jgi:hypothetical protein